MAIPHLYALLYNVKKRVIIAGDFQQLGPISVACTDMSEKWLKKELFSLLGKKNIISKHPNVRMLTNQSRCATVIIDLVNRRFYDGLLTTDLTE